MTYSDLENNVPERYEISLHKGVKITGGIFFAAWWLFLVYMTFTSRIEGLASYVIAYGFFIFASCFVTYTVCELVRSKLVVTGGSVTRYFPFAPPKTYCIDEITQVVVRATRRGGTTYRVYARKKKIFELHNFMVNYNLFLGTLEEKGVPFKNSKF